MKKPKGKREKKVKYQDEWVLSSGLVEVHFVNDLATEIRFQGVLFKYSLPTLKQVK